MRGVVITFWGVMQLAGCSVGKPPVNEIAAIEKVTARNSCVGNLGRWHRTYYFQPANFGVDKSDIQVFYVEAGHLGKRAGRYITEPPTKWPTDDGQFAFAGGNWDRSSGRFKDWVCGCNVGSKRVQVGPPVCAQKGS